MKRLYASLLTLCILSVLSHAQQVSLYDELEPLYPDSKIDVPVNHYSIDAARGTITAVHLLVTGLTPGKSLRFLVKGAPRPMIRQAEWYRLIDVPVAENTGLDSRTEKFSGQINPYVIRRAPFRIFEAMEPVGHQIKVKNPVTALRLEIPIDPRLQQGVYNFDILLHSGKWSTHMSLVIKVYPVGIPPLNKAHLNYVNWHSISNICKDHHVKKWSRQFWNILDNYARLMAKGRQNTFWFIWSDFFSFNADGTVKDFFSDRLNRYIRTFMNEGLTTIQGAPFTRRRNWSSDAMLVSIPIANGGEVSATSDLGQQIIRQMAEPITRFMEKRQWDHHWYQGIFDEPTNQYVSRYQKVVQLIKSIKPDIRILEATMTVELAGSVNCWCPQVQEYQKHQDFFQQRQAAGDEVWVYTCLIPGGPWINRLVDQERLRPVYVGWACAKYDLQGFLHWGFNHHRGNPFENLVVSHGDAKNFLPAGDSHIVYPGRKTPWSSQRFEAHRIGMEDYELLFQLKQKKPGQAQKIINQLFRAFDNYDKNISHYRHTKRELLQLLSHS